MCPDRHQERCIVDVFRGHSDIVLSTVPVVASCLAVHCSRFPLAFEARLVLNAVRREGSKHEELRCPIDFATL